MTTADDARVESAPGTETDADDVGAPGPTVAGFGLSDVSAAGGGLLWLVAAVFDLLPTVELVLALAPLVLVPVGMGMVHTPTRDGRTAAPYRLAVLAQPVGAASTLASLLSAPGTRVAAVLALPWLVVTVLVALFGCWRALPRGGPPLSELSIDAGLAYAVVGATALLFHAAGVTLWFAPTIVLLTSVHFHYAGFVVPLVTGLAGRTIGPEPGPLYRTLAALVIVGPGIVGLGIAFSPLVELFAVAIFTVAVSVLALLLVTRVAPTRPPVQGGAVGLSAVVLPISMAFAFAFGLSQYLETVLFGLDLGTMVTLHGLLNAFGFALLGLLGWRLAVPESAVDAPGIPFSRLRSRGRVGADFFERRSAVEDSSEPPAGQVDSFDVYDRAGFDATAVSPSVRRFYEETGSYDLSYAATWHGRFALPARLVAPIARRLEQLNLPGPTAGVQTADSRLVWLSEPADSRSDCRGWIRTDETGRGVFVSAYATHERNGVTYMNVGLPLPWANLTAILRPEADAFPDEDRGERASPGPTESDGGNETAPSGLRLTSRRDGSNGAEFGDEGLYLVTPWLPIRLPVNEEFRVRPVGASASQSERPSFADGETDLVATHEMWVFGRRFLTITYAICLDK